MGEQVTEKCGKVPILGSLLGEPDSYRTYDEDNPDVKGYGSTREKAQEDFERKNK